MNGLGRAQFITFLKSLGIGIDESGMMRLPERIAAARSGLVTFGANTFAYSKKAGSFVVLSAFLIDVELEFDEPTIKRPCPPDCRNCVEACPTGALFAPGKLNPTKCLLAMQVRPAVIDEEKRVQMGSSIHGCDRCQEVCVRNKAIFEKAKRKDPFLERLAEEFDLEKILLLDDAYYERVVYPIMYNYITEPWLFQRNAAIALGNTKDPRHLPALNKAKKCCPDEVQEYLDWAITQVTL